MLVRCGCSLSVFIACCSLFIADCVYLRGVSLVAAVCCCLLLVVVLVCFCPWLVLVSFDFVVDGCRWRLLRCVVWLLLFVVVVVVCCLLLL